MEATLLTTGLICLLAAIVGGGLKGLGFEFPILQTRRQVLLGLLGILLIIVPQWNKISDELLRLSRDSVDPAATRKPDPTSAAPAPQVQTEPVASSPPLTSPQPAPQVQTEPVASSPSLTSPQPAPPQTEPAVSSTKPPQRPPVAKTTPRTKPPTGNELSRAVRGGIGDSVSGVGEGVRRWSVWLDLPAAKLNTLSRVEYWFHHSTFRNPKVGKADRRFKAEWYGWGCVPNATVVATTVSGTKIKGDFSLCEVVGIKE